MLVRHRLAVVCAVLAVAAVFTVAKATDPSWVAPMTTVHNAFKTAHPGEPFKISRFGDSITYSAAFFRQFRNNWAFTNVTTAEQDAVDWLKSVLDAPCWTWQDDPASNAAAHGAMSGTTSAWPLQNDMVPAPKGTTRNIDYWLATDKPAVAIIMWGTNDVAVPTIDVTTYTNNMRQVVQACKAFGTIPVLTTIPPRVGYVTETATFAQAIIDLATEQQVPCIDYHGEILDRRPAIWSTTLIDADGIHPSAAVGTAGNPDGWMESYDFADATLYKWGYTLRNWMTLHAIWDVQNYILHIEPRGNVAIRIYDTALSDVPGPQPIRVFPIPQAAVTDPDPKVAQVNGWAGAQIAYDNWAEGLNFSTTNHPDYSSLVNLPITKPNVVISGVKNPGDPSQPITEANAFDVVTGPYECYVTQEGLSTHPKADNRFPYRVPRLARDAWKAFMSVVFEFPQPVKAFGVFVPAASNNGPDDTEDDQNFYRQRRSVYLSVIDETDIPMQMYKSLKIADQETYCPFVAFISDGVHGLKKVSIIHDQIESGMGIGGLISIMDAYIIPGVQPLIGDINNDGYVNVGDLQALVAAWGSQAGPPPSANWNAAADINKDNYVNVGDLQLLVAHWGEHR